MIWSLRLFQDEYEDYDSDEDYQEGQDEDDDDEDDGNPRIVGNFDPGYVLRIPI